MSCNKKGLRQKKSAGGFYICVRSITGIPHRFSVHRSSPALSFPAPVNVPGYGSLLLQSCLQGGNLRFHQSGIRCSPVGIVKSLKLHPVCYQINPVIDHLNTICPETVGLFVGTAEGKSTGEFSFGIDHTVAGNMVGIRVLV